MASINKKRKENIEGNFFVDETCINCDTCRWVSPKVFKEEGGQSSVYFQPQTDEEKISALQALLACPTSSIGTKDKLPEMKEALHSFPLLVEDNVFHCGFHSEQSFGAASYFIQREEGNVLIDSPKFVKPLVKQLEKLGGIRYLYLTHKDDVADHQLFHEHFGCERILHKDDVGQDTRMIETQLEGLEPYKLSEDIIIIPVPGHTKGSSILLYKDKFLFTGDHLAYSDSRQQLVAFKGACWYSWAEQEKSMENLENYAFEWILPGHGRRYHANKIQMKKDLQHCIQWMKNT